MISSAWTSRNRSPTLTATCSRRLCRPATSWTMLLRAGRSAGAAGRPLAAGPLCDRRFRALAAAIHRLQQVVDGVHLERLDGVLVEGGHEDDVPGGSSVHQFRRATSKPVSPGIWMSRNTRSGL